MVLRTTTQLSESLLSHWKPSSGLRDFMVFKTDYFSYIPVPLDVSKPLLQSERQHQRTQNDELIEFTSTAQSLGEDEAKPNTSLSDCAVSAQNEILNSTGDITSQIGALDNIATSNFNQTSYSPEAPASPLNHIPFSPTIPELITRKPRRKYRKRKIVSQAVIEQKRENFLKRNRLAANRYREKRREWVTELEATQKEQRQTNMKLLEEKESLRAEIQELKSWLSRCTTCTGGTLDDATEPKIG